MLDLVTLSQTFVRCCHAAIARLQGAGVPVASLTLARDFDPRELGLLYYVMASSQTLGDALKRVARYSRITNEALVSPPER